MSLLLEEYRPEPEGLDSAISRREGLILSVVTHVLLILAVLYAPQLPFVQAMLARTEEARAREAERAALAVQPAPRWVFTSPRASERPPLPPPDALLSDRDGQARARERAQQPTNRLPFSRGNSPEFVDEPGVEARARGQGPAPTPAPPAQAPQVAQNTTAANESVLRLPEVDRGQTPPQRSTTPPSSTAAAPTTPGGRLGQALRNLEKYLPNETFDNPAGAARFGQDFDFDRKGVEFGPWIRYFRAQVRGNWLIPEAAAVMRGHVVLTLNVWRDGRISDIVVVQPSGIEAFDRAAANALRWSNPTRPLPAEYPDQRVFFTVTFYYNEYPPAP